MRFINYCWITTCDDIWGNILSYNAPCGYHTSFTHGNTWQHYWVGAYPNIITNRDWFRSSFFIYSVLNIFKWSVMATPIKNLTVRDNQTIFTDFYLFVRMDATPMYSSIFPMWIIAPWWSANSFTGECMLYDILHFWNLDAVLSKGSEKSLA